MALERLPHEESAGAAGRTSVPKQRPPITQESWEGDSPLGGNGEATRTLRQELVGLTILGAATITVEESPKFVVDFDSNESSFEPSYIGERMPRRKIRPTVQPEARALLSDRLWGLLEPAISISATTAKRSGIRIDSIDIDSFRDPEEGWAEVVLNISVVANASQALAFWDSIGRAIDRWKQFLPKDLAETLDDRIAVHIFWS